MRLAQGPSRTMEISFVNWENGLND